MPAPSLHLLAALLVGIALTGCGSSGHSGLGSADAARLHADIAAARTAAARHQGSQAATSLVALRRQVARLEAEHKLTAAQAQALEIGAEQAQARVALDVKPAAATATTPAAPTPAPTPPGPPGKAKGHDKHRGPGGGGDGQGDGGD